MLQASATTRAAATSAGSGTPRLSVIVPFYGVEDYIGDCLESIRVQHLHDIEVIMVDDGSPDGSRAIAEQYAAMDDRFRIVTKANGGLGPARNTGVEHAAAEYLTFIDSDDLVARPAFERMLNCLDRTGSSFALCNARRFSRTSGVRQSWTHQQICSQTRLGTHIYEFPSLIRDRMVWNKVYRRSFWDAQGYQFPAIRYEDYPVTLPAHLAALTVDVVSLYGYYWRERESGDSITQQAFAYDNLLDRVVSAEMVLDAVDRNGTPAIRTTLSRYLAEIDLVALLQAFAEAPAEDLDRLLRLGHRLADRLAIKRSERPRFDQIQLAALRADDVPLLQELARFRADGGLVGGVRATRRALQPWRFDAAYPGRTRSDAPRSAYTFPVTSLTLRTAVTGLRWSGRDLCLDATAEISHLLAQDDSLVQVSLVNGIDRHELPLERYRTTDQHGGRSLVGLRTRVPLDTIAPQDELLWPLRLEVDVRNQGVHRVGLLRNLQDGSPSYPPIAPLTEGEWIVPGNSSGNVLAIRREVDPTVLHRIEEDEGGGLLLTVSVPERCRYATLRVDRPAAIGAIEIRCAVSDSGGMSRVVARLDPGVVIDGDTPDDPFTLRATRRLRLMTDVGDFPLFWPAYTGDAAAPVGDRLVSVTRSAYGAAVLTHGPATPTTDGVTLDDGTVTAHGRSWAGPPRSIAWRRYLAGSDEYVDLPTELSVDAEHRWTACADLADLVPPPGTVPFRPGAATADWVLFTGSDSVRATPAASAATPLSAEHDGHRFEVTTHAATLRVRVR